MKKLTVVLDGDTDQRFKRLEFTRQLTRELLIELVLETGLQELEREELTTAHSLLRVADETLEYSSDEHALVIDYLATHKDN